LEGTVSVAGMRIPVSAGLSEKKTAARTYLKPWILPIMQQFPRQIPRGIMAMTVRKKRTRKSADPDMPSLSFDDALALLIQLEPGNMEGFKQLSEALQSASANSSLDASIVQLT
jgi:hypothetical protein